MLLLKSFIFKQIKIYIYNVKITVLYWLNYMLIFEYTIHYYLRQQPYDFREIKN